MFRVASIALLCALLTASVRAQSVQVHNNCASAGALSVGINTIAFVCSYSNDASPCHPTGANGWLKFTPASTDTYYFTLERNYVAWAGGINLIGLRGVYSGACGALNSLQCFAFQPPPSPFFVPGTMHCALALTAGTEYRIEIAISGSCPNDSMLFEVLPSATNDECSGALAIDAGGTPISISNATTSAVQSCPKQKDEWYSFTPPCTRTYTVNIDAGPSNTNAYSVDIYDACGGTLLACGGAGHTLTMSAGAAYLIHVGIQPLYVQGAYSTLSLNNAILYVTDHFGLELTVTPGFLSIGIECGAPYGAYFTPVTLVPGNFPNGWFLGIDITWFELITQLSAAPFVGALDSEGSVTNGPYAVPPGLTLYAVGVSDLFQPIWKASPPATVTTI